MQANAANPTDQVDMLLIEALGSHQGHIVSVGLGSMIVVGIGDRVPEVLFLESIEVGAWAEVLIDH